MKGRPRSGLQLRREARHWVALLAFLFVCALSSSALAQANYESALLGGRTAMMGGAAVAAGEDQANAFINPAGITRIPGQSLSFSTFAASFSSRNIGSALDPNGELGLEGTDVNELTLRVLPNTFCLFLNGPPETSASERSRHKYAVCAATTEREELAFTRNLSETNVDSRTLTGSGHSTSMKFVRSTLAMSWGMRLNRDTSIGVTARVDNARFKDNSTSVAYDGGGGLGRMSNLNLSRNAWSWDTSLVLGLTSNISRVVTLGVSLTTPSQHLLGSYVGVTSGSISGSATNVVVQDDGDFRYNHPGSLKLGLAFSWPELILEIDGNFYGPQRQLARAGFDRSVTVAGSTGTLDSTSYRDTITERGKPVTNLSVGMEYFLERDFSIITGVQTDFSGVHTRSDSRIDEVLFRQNKDVIHASIGFSTYQSTGRLLLGLRGHYARGKVLILDAAAPSVSSQLAALSQNEWGLSLVVAGRISFQAVRDTAARAAEPFNRFGDNGEDDDDNEDEDEGQAQP